ncbi:hypothetical protein EST38_g11635 [Candolleomyces aberdarensis]|uniref:Uncharacterized protein n=1 Tax=Candolleomyces aberdarensis TaxID=2316362 RepID=A0A4Q2D4E9_9AGAR|nr:hypothetical protein EST38_g11635 [Candolleomyces aberdarensis]
MIRLAVGALALLLPTAFAADCRVATVGSPHSNCWDIATAAGISTTQLSSFNPGLDCGKLQPGQRLCISSGTLPNISPKPNPDGSCATHTVAPGTWCALIATQYGITEADIERFNKNTYKWKGCSSLQANAIICVSSGTPPPIPVNPNLQCGPESPGNKTCPLNLRRTCGGSQLKRKIGYYAGWAARRSCQSFKPNNLDLQGYTGVIFAFATISQSNEISLASADEQILRDTANLKNKWPNLEVTIAVGGWAFSMDDPTKTLFTQMISTRANRAKFITSVQNFLSKYNLDGIDIDMEYPAAIERQGPTSDTPNLTAFFSEIKTALGSKVVSVAAPAGYWFLRGFEINKIVKDVTYINMMSYDFHGPWDLAVQGEDGTAKPHTSSKEIMDAINLYTRAGVDFNKVNLGLAWYGRTYAVGGCRGTGCLMSGGGKPGPCTGESSIKSQTEIWNEIKDAKITPTYDSNTHTYWYNKDGDFITYDDTNSWKYNLNGTDKCETAASALRPFGCYKDCCLYLGVGEYDNVQIRAKEVKEAALSILDICHGAGLSRRGAQRRALPLAALVPMIIGKWNMIVYINIGAAVIGALATALSVIFKNWNDDEDRGEFVLQTVQETQKKYPEFNIIMAHSDHTPSFEEPCYHRHVEFDRPFPHGTYGYEIYLARRGNFTLKGDGGYMNWAWSGYISEDPNNKKQLAVHPPGAGYGYAAPVQGKYVENGQTKSTELIVSLG